MAANDPFIKPKYVARGSPCIDVFLFQPIGLLLTQALPPPQRQAYMLKHNSTHGQFEGQIDVDGSDLVLNDAPMFVYGVNESDRVQARDQRPLLGVLHHELPRPVDQGHP